MQNTKISGKFLQQEKVGRLISESAFFCFCFCIFIAGVIDFMCAYTPLCMCGCEFLFPKIIVLSKCTHTHTHTMKSNALEKSTYNSVASRFLARSPSMIRWIVRICEVKDRLFQEIFWFFLRINLSRLRTSKNRSNERKCFTLKKKSKGK